MPTVDFWGAVKKVVKISAYIYDSPLVALGVWSALFITTLFSFYELYINFNLPTFDYLSSDIISRDSLCLTDIFMYCCNVSFAYKILSFLYNFTLFIVSTLFSVLITITISYFALKIKKATGDAIRTAG